MARVAQVTADFEIFSRISTVLLGHGTYFDNPRIRPWKRVQLEPKQYLNDWLRMESLDQSPLRLRSQFLSFLGLSDMQSPGMNGSKSSEDFCPLEGLSAAKLLAGPFLIDFTERAPEHLTFSGSRNKPVLKLLSLEKVKMLYIPQRVGIAT